METEMVETLKEFEVQRPLILTTRKFRRSASFGTQVWRSVTRNFDFDQEIEHVEIACPNYKLTDRGPVLERKEKDDEPQEPCDCYTRE